MDPRRVFRRMVVAQTVAGVAGSAVVSVFLTVFLAAFGDGAPLWWENTVVLVLYLALAYWVGRTWGHREFESVSQWLREDRLPTEAEREAVLRLPTNGVRVAATLWGAGC